MEIARQELQDQLDDKEAKLIRLTSEKAKLVKELQNIELAKAEDDNNSATASHLHEQQRHRLLTELQELKKENATLQQQLNDANNTNALHYSNEESSSSHASTTAHHHHHHVEIDKLKQSLTHAHRTMANLRMALHREKKERMETAKLLAESQDTIEELTATPHDLNHKRMSGDKVLKQQHDDDNDTCEEVKKEACDTTNHISSSLDVLPTTSTSLFNELQQSNNNQAHDKETQTEDLLDHVDIGIQVAVPEEEEQHSYLDSLKRVWNESSLSLKHVMSSHYASSDDIKNEQEETPNPAPVISSNHSSKLAMYAAKYINNYLPPHPVSSVSMQHPRVIAPPLLKKTSAHDDFYTKPTPSISDTMAGSSIHKHHITSDMPAVANDMQEDIGPKVIQALTHGMIGDWMYKFTRRYVAGKTGNRRHYRYFWIHPYTKTLYWSYTQPGVDHDESRSKRGICSLIFYIHQLIVSTLAFIRDVYNIPCPQPSSTPFHLMVRTPTRDIVLQANSIDQHQQWLVVS